MCPDAFDVIGRKLSVSGHWLFLPSIIRVLLFRGAAAFGLFAPFERHFIHRLLSLPTLPHRDEERDEQADPERIAELG